MLLRSILLAASLLVVTAGDAQRDNNPVLSDPDIIAVTGHGMVFDDKMRPIDLDLRSILAMQASIRTRLDRATANSPRAKALVAPLEGELARTRSVPERGLLAAALINRQLAAAPLSLQARYTWRNQVLYQQLRTQLDLRGNGKFVISEQLKRWLRQGGLIKAGLFDTDYMADCRAQSVPVPPDFSTTKKTQWVKQGDLTYNILNPGKQASVWTWSDPVTRGACIALPRENGVAGVICQSATTGRACFWDNLRQDDTGDRIPVATEMMQIRKVQDGRTLAENLPCTQCHTGNNVFLLSPDDPTWAKVIRGPLAGQHPNKFTTVVESQTSPLGGPRYTPIAYASWVNPPLQQGCSGACHGAPSSVVQGLYDNLGDAQRPPMPPACAGSEKNYKLCYGTP